MNTDWIKENGSNWSAGRIECYDSENSYGYASREYPILIDSKDWNQLDDYLRSINTKELKSFDELIDMSRLSIVKFQNS